MEYTEDLLDHDLYFDKYVISSVEQPAPEMPTDILIIIPGPSSDQVRMCCLGCEDINFSEMSLVPVEGLPPRNPFNINQGRAMCCYAVHEGQHASCGHCSDHHGYSGVTQMQPLGGCHLFPDWCE